MGGCEQDLKKKKKVSANWKKVSRDLWTVNQATNHTLYAAWSSRI